MNNWYATERLAASRRADLEREARGDALLRAADEQDHDLNAGRSTHWIVAERFHLSALLGRARAMIRAFLARGSAA